VSEFEKFDRADWHTMKLPASQEVRLAIHNHPLKEILMTQKTFLSHCLVAAVSTALLVQAPLAKAEIVDTQDLAAQSQTEQDQAKVRSFLERANVKEKLEAMGVKGLVAQDRVASLSEQEVHALAERIDAMPAGGTLSQTDMIFILLIAILIALIL
jgi:hypothetical protein